MLLDILLLNDNDLLILLLNGLGVSRGFIILVKFVMVKR